MPESNEFDKSLTVTDDSKKRLAEGEGSSELIAGEIKPAVDSGPNTASALLNQIRADEAAQVAEAKKRKQAVLEKEREAERFTAAKAHQGNEPPVKKANSNTLPPFPRDIIEAGIYNPTKQRQVLPYRSEKEEEYSKAGQVAEQRRRRKPLPVWDPAPDPLLSRPKYEAENKSEASIPVVDIPLAVALGWWVDPNEPITGKKNSARLEMALRLAKGDFNPGEEMWKLPGIAKLMDDAGIGGSWNLAESAAEIQAFLADKKHSGLLYQTVRDIQSSIGIPEEIKPSVIEILEAHEGTIGKIQFWKGLLYGKAPLLFPSVYFGKIVNGVRALSGLEFFLDHLARVTPDARTMADYTKACTDVGQPGHPIVERLKITIQTTDLPTRYPLDPRFLPPEPALLSDAFSGKNDNGFLWLISYLPTPVRLAVESGIRPVYEGLGIPPPSVTPSLRDEFSSIVMPKSAQQRYLNPQRLLTEYRGRARALAEFYNGPILSELIFQCSQSRIPAGNMAEDKGKITPGKPEKGSASGFVFWLKDNLRPTLGSILAEKQPVFNFPSGRIDDPALQQTEEESRNAGQEITHMLTDFLSAAQIYVKTTDVYHYLCSYDNDYNPDSRHQVFEKLMRLRYPDLPLVNVLTFFNKIKIKVEGLFDQNKQKGEDLAGSATIAETFIENMIRNGFLDQTKTAKGEPKVSSNSLTPEYINVVALAELCGFTPQQTDQFYEIMKEDLLGHYDCRIESQLARQQLGRALARRPVSRAVRDTVALWYIPEPYSPVTKTVSALIADGKLELTQLAWARGYEAGEVMQSREKSNYWPNPERLKRIKGLEPWVSGKPAFGDRVPAGVVTEIVRPIIASQVLTLLAILVEFDRDITSLCTPAERAKYAGRLGDETRLSITAKSLAAFKLIELLNSTNLNGRCTDSQLNDILTQAGNILLTFEEQIGREDLPKAEMNSSLKSLPEPGDIWPPPPDTIIYEERTSPEKPKSDLPSIESGRSELNKWSTEKLIAARSALIAVLPKGNPISFISPGDEESRRARRMLALIEKIMVEKKLQEPPQ